MHSPLVISRARRRSVTPLAGLVLALAVLVSPSTPSAAATAVSPWAVASSTGSSYNPNLWASRISQLGVGTVRGFDQEWPAGLTTTTNSGLNVTGVLQWSSGSTYTFPTADLNGWRSYVRRMVSSYPSVTDWEVWNEPPNFSASGSPGDYAAIVAAAYDTAKAVRPSARIGLATKASDARWLSATIKAGAADHFDFVTLHPYERLGGLVSGQDLSTGNELGFMSIVPTVRSMLAVDDPAKASVPIRFSEFGFASTPNNSAALQTQADALVKGLTMSVAQGVEQAAWFDPWDGDAPDSTNSVFGLLDRNLTLRPAGAAYGQLISALGKYPTYLGWAAQADGALGFIFNTGSTTTMVTWSRDSDGATESFSNAVRTVDPATGTTATSSTVAVSRKPVIVVASGAASQTLRSMAAANANRPFGAVTSADDNLSSRVTLSRDNPRGGIEVFNGASPCTLAGVAAYCAKDSGPSFTVSPKFAKWAGSTVTLTIVMRAVSGNPGFGLKYDANLPYLSLDWAGNTSSPGWNYVGSGAWTTKSWTLPNFSPNGKYGFNFRLDSDSSVYSSFAISQITLTKS